MDRQKDAGLKAILKQLIEHGADDMANIFARMLARAMRIERERFLGAPHYERTPSRRGHANSFKPHRIGTPACAPPAGPCWAGQNGSAVSSTWRGTPFITRRMPPSAKRIGAGVRTVRDAPHRQKAQAALAEQVAACHDTAPKRADWLEESVPEGLTVFALPGHHRRHMRTSNPIERAIQQKLKRRTVKVRVFPNGESLERLLSAVFIEIDERRAVSPKAYQRGMSGCMISTIPNFQTWNCVI